ncbi:uncharacterized protein LOC133927295 isoform X1 [Phragmites australis]|uniref:uncharacterized protein LOC133927295 isoform X1 n=1 Tax=Phragmites australis TaxID=29695 RepID=UPI002D793F7F|nr:uncharacterized protein LOC133927295 isoform X1 [Phragmites australis]
MFVVCSRDLKIPGGHSHELFLSVLSRYNPNSGMCPQLQKSCCCTAASACSVPAFPVFLDGWISNQALVNSFIPPTQGGNQTCGSQIRRTSHSQRQHQPNNVSNYLSQYHSPPKADRLPAVNPFHRCRDPRR